MNIIFYTNHSDPRTLNKSLTELSTHDIKLLKPTNILHPQLDLSTQIPPSANYCYIEALGRYYYINEPVIIPGKINSSTLDVDPLMSFKAIINSSDVIANRSTNKANKLLPDTLPVLAKRNVIYKALKGGAHDIGAFGSEYCNAAGAHYLLTVLNGQHEEAGATTLEVVEINGANVRLAWDTIPDVETYWIYRKAPGALDFEIIERAPTGTYYTDTVTATGEYQYKVCGVIGGVPGADSNIVTANVEE